MNLHLRPFLLDSQKRSLQQRFPRPTVMINTKLMTRAFLRIVNRQTPPLPSPFLLSTGTLPIRRFPGVNRHQLSKIDVTDLIFKK